MAGRKRPRLFSFGREIELANLESWVEDPDQRDLLVNVIDAFLEITRTRKLTDATLAPIEMAASHASPSVRAIGVTRLVVLAHYFEPADLAYAGLAQHPDDAVRLYACSSLANAPESLVLQMIGDFLQDPAWEVRKAAAQVCTAFRLAEILTCVQKRLGEERDARVRVVLELALRFQHDQRP